MEYEKNLISEHLPQNEFFWNACKLVISSIDKIDKKEVDDEKGEKWSLLWSWFRVWVMWESYRMDKAVWKEDGHTENQDNYPQQNHAPDSVAFSPEIDTNIRKYNTEK